MKYLSICSGIEAASVAFEPLGWRPLAFSEIEAFPRAVLKHHYPDTPCHGDFTTLKDEPWIVDADMLCGGTPCQAFSVAGNRQSLADDRGNLTLQFVLLADAIDHLRSTAGKQPAWILWENVPGVFSTNDNAFGSFLGGLVGRTAPIPEPEGGWTGAGVVDGPTRCAAWRTLDAQHFGLAQRRKRVFVLARGGVGRWAVADALLPIIESSSWHPAPSRSTGERVARATQEGAGGDVEGVDYENNPVWAGEPMGPLMKGSPTGGGRPLPVVAFAQNTRDEVRFQGDGDICGTLAAEPGMKQTTYVAFDPTLSSRPSGGGGLGTDFDLDGGLIEVLAIRNSGRDSDMREGRNGTTMQTDTMFTLQAQQQHSVAYPIQECNVSRANLNGTGTGIGEAGDPMFTLQAAQPHGVCASLSLRTRDGVVSAELGEPGIANALRGSDGGRAGEGAGAVLNGMQVRRLTPVECERLQGFPIVRQMLYIAACLDPASGSVDVALRCHRLQSSVWPADANELMQFAATAEEHSNTPQASQEPLVLARVLMHSEAKVQEFRSAGKLIWSARSADEQSECHQLTRVETIAHALARHGHVVAKEIMDGKEASPQNTSGSSHRKNGEVCVTLSIAGTKANAGDATNDHRGDGPQFTTSELGQVIPKEDSTLATALCSVLHAIAGSIPEQTLPENFSIAIEVGRGYTNIPWRGKPESPDGPRYKALGNSWAVPCARWIGERIKAIRP